MAERPARVAVPSEQGDMLKAREVRAEREASGSRDELEGLDRLSFRAGFPGRCHLVDDCTEATTPTERANLGKLPLRLKTLRDSSPR